MALRKRIVAAREEDGESLGEIAERLRIPRGTVQRVLEHYRDTGSLEPKPRKAGRKPAFDAQALARLEADVTAHPDATLAELRDRSGLKVSQVTVHNTLKKLGYTRKKSLYTRKSKNAKT